jgi:hypothetical protein
VTVPERVAARVRRAFRGEEAREVVLDREFGPVS